MRVVCMELLEYWFEHNYTLRNIFLIVLMIEYMRCRRSNGRGSVVKNDKSRIPISDNGTNQHFYIEPASI